jgi:hypothetical protein
MVSTLVLVFLSSRLPLLLIRWKTLKKAGVDINKTETNDERTTIPQGSSPRLPSHLLPSILTNCNNSFSNFQTWPSNPTPSAKRNRRFQIGSTSQLFWSVPTAPMLHVTGLVAIVAHVSSAANICAYAKSGTAACSIFVPNAAASLLSFAVQSCKLEMEYLCLIEWLLCQ